MPDDHRTEPIHPWRWRALAFWIAIFTATVIWMVGDNRHQIEDLNDNKANLAALQATNCGLKKFLLQARKARLDAAVAADKRGDKDEAQSNRDAAAGYVSLVAPFTGRAVGECRIPPAIQIRAG